jgi:hypothetical protein
MKAALLQRFLSDLRSKHMKFDASESCDESFPLHNASDMYLKQIQSEFAYNSSGESVTTTENDTTRSPSISNDGIIEFKHQDEQNRIPIAPLCTLRDPPQQDALSFLAEITATVPRMSKKTLHARGSLSADERPAKRAKIDQVAAVTSTLGEERKGPERQTRDRGSIGPTLTIAANQQSNTCLVDFELAFELALAKVRQTAIWKKCMMNPPSLYTQRQTIIDVEEQEVEVEDRSQTTSKSIWDSILEDCKRVHPAVPSLF